VARFISNVESESYTIALRPIVEAIDQIQEASISFRKDSILCVEKEFETASRTIGGLLIAPVKYKLKRKIKIQTNGYLLNIPWDALLINMDQKNKSMHYLIKDYQVIISSIPWIKRKVKMQLDKAKILAIAPKFEAKKYLKNQQELEMITGKMKIICLTDLNKGRIIKKIENAALPFLHISSHGTIRSDGQNGIFITEKEELSVKEINKMKIKADVVFLNTCESAKAFMTENKYESFCKAFIRSGAKSSIGTLWSIQDEVSIEMADYFYHFISKGYSNAEALRSAKLKYIAEVELKSKTHPLTWGAYQIYGEELGSQHSNLIELRSFVSIGFSILTSVSMLSFYFGKRIRKMAIEYNLL
jgi:CHAT domain-containing protein